LFSFWQGERGRHRDGSRPNQKSTKTLFVINFDPNRTRVSDIERHFIPYGPLHHVQIHRNFAFVQYETQEDTTKALKCKNIRSVSH
jgi:splicing factor, arginine/serine-rich 4/5/6